MGRVTFNGDIATAESQAYIRREEQRIYAQAGKDEFQLAREVELLYRDNGLEPGTFYRAGYNAHDRDGGSGSGFAFVNPIRWALGFALVLFAVAWMNNFGNHSPEQQVYDKWIDCERDKTRGRIPRTTDCGPRPKIPESGRM